ncbi:MAG: beta-ketoacyl-[acyl-carrier-protein] synthase family protein, partial [Candidatus Limnocylindrus sp.]
MREADHTRRVVITGLGIVSPIGNDVSSAWASLTQMKSGLGRISHWDPTAYAPYVVAGEIHGFDATAWLDPKSVRRTGPEIHWGVAAAKQALSHAGLEITDANREEIGVVFGSGAGGQGLFIENQMAWKEKGPRSVAPTFIAHGLVDSCSGMIAIETGAVGHNMAVVSACATGTHALGEAAEAIKRGDVTAVIAGSTENPLIEVAHIGFMNMRGLGAPRDGEGPASASRPFDVDRAGFVLGEGAGAFIVEDLEHAKARGATIYAEVVGYG